MGLLPLGVERVDGYNLNPVKFSLNCFIAALFMEIPGPVYVCGLGEKMWCGAGGNCVGGLFSNFFCTFGTVTINEPPFKPFFSMRWEASGSLDQHCPIELSVIMEMFYNLHCLIHVAIEL